MQQTSGTIPIEAFINTDFHLGVIVTDLTGHILWQNQRFRELFSLNASNAPWHEKIHEEDRPRYERHWKHSLKNGEYGKSIDFRVGKEPEETTRWLRARSKNLGNHDDYQEVAFTTFEEITLPHIKEEELYLQANLLFEINDAVISLDTSRKINYWNKGAERLYGLKARDIIGKKLRDAFLFKWINLEDKLKSKSELLKKGYTKIVLCHEKHDGTEITVEVSMQYNYDSITGQRSGITSIIRDITEQKEKENDLRKALHYIKILLDRAEEEKKYLQSEINLSQKFGAIITRSAIFQKVLLQIQQVASSNATVLITGETGTGKELLARAVHDHSRQKNKALVKVNCASLPANLIESELFGHEKGAFTGAVSRKLGRFEIADGGSIFLDEIGELPLDLQSKLLRVLQEGEYERLGDPQTRKVNVRVIAATNRNLEELVKTGDFRADLFYRLNVFPIHVPPLRSRKEDIPSLVSHFIKKYSRTSDKNIKKVPKEVIRELQGYHWPGNVRELENIIERAVIITQGQSLQLGNWLTKSASPSEEKNDFVTLAEKERKYITEVLESVHWKISGSNSAASILGLKPTTLRSRMEKLGIRRP